MDATAKEMVWLVVNSDNKARREDAAETLLAIAPTLDDDAVEYVVHEMTWVISNSDNQIRRKIAQKVLIIYKGVQAMRR